MASVPLRHAAVRTAIRRPVGMGSLSAQGSVRSIAALTDSIPTSGQLRGVATSGLRGSGWGSALVAGQQQQKIVALRAPGLSGFRQLRFKSQQAEQEQEKKEGEEGAKKEGEEAGEKKAEGEGEKKKKDAPPPPPPPPHGNKSPLTVFMETLRSGFAESQEWQESRKAIASSAHEFTESPAVKKAREALEKSAKVADKAGTASSETVKKVGKVVGQGVAWTWETPVVKAGRTVVRKTGEGVAAATKPVRETEAYKKVSENLKEAIDDGSSSRYGGYLDREERRRLREERELKELKSGKRKVNEIVEENPEAGESVTLHKDAAWKEQWREFRDSNKFMQKLFDAKKNMEESENPIISSARDIADRFASFFAENEQALVIKKLKEMDPSFQLEPFLRDLREYILPEVLDAYVTGNKEVLEQWLSAAQFSVYAELMKEYTKAGLKSDGRILDIRNVDILKARMLEPGDIPVLLITCRTQEVHVYRDAKTNVLAAGMEDRVQQVTYVIGMTRIPEEVRNPETMGWRLLELQKAGRDYI